MNDSINEKDHVSTDHPQVDQFTIATPGGTLRRSVDGCSYTFGNDSFPLNAPQSKVADLLWTTYKNGPIFWAERKTLLLLTGGQRVQDLFRRGDGAQFYERFMERSRSGRYRLKIRTAE